jgi:hypothetical protein
MTAAMQMQKIGKAGPERNRGIMRLVALARSPISSRTWELP